MYSPEITIVVAGVAALGLGLGVGFKLGKQHGMKLATDAYDFVKSFGVGQKGVQAGVGTPANPTQCPAQQSVWTKGGGGAGGFGTGGGGGGGGYGVAIGAPNQLNELYNLCLRAGMSPTDATKVVGDRMQQQTAHQQALMQKKLEYEYRRAFAEVEKIKGKGV